MSDPLDRWFRRAMLRLWLSVCAMYVLIFLAWRILS